MSGASIYEPGYRPGDPGFTGLRMDLEDHQAILNGSSPYSPLMSAGEWMEAEVFSWWNIRNQSQKNSCRGHSLAASARMCYYMAAGGVDLDEDGQLNEALQDDFSPDYCYYESQRANNINSDSGATINGGIRVGLAGIAREIDLPYQLGYSPSRVTSAIREKATKFKFGRYTKMTTAEQIFDWTGTGQGCIDWGTVWPLPFVKGCLVKGLPSGTRGGGHATCPLGIARGETIKRLVPVLKTEFKDDEWILQVANSHSENAQFKGFYFCTMDAVADILRHNFTEALGWSDMATPVVRPFDFRKGSVFG